MKKGNKHKKPILKKVSSFSDLKKTSQESEPITSESIEEKNKASLKKIYENLIKATEAV